MLATHCTESLLSLEDACITKVLSNSTTITIYLEQKRKPHVCPICNTTTDTIHDYRQ